MHTVDNILKISNLTKKYQRKLALDSVSFDVQTGSIFGLLGPNGAGKTTLIRILTQIFKPDSGKILFKNSELKADDVYSFGYMPEERGLYKKMQVEEQLLYLAQLRGLSLNEAKQKLSIWFEKFKIEDWRYKKVEELSKGMQQKVQFIATVIHEPVVMILDEPLSGLDPVNSEIINQEILRLKSLGSTIIFSTHRMEQVEEICDHILLLNKGKTIEYGVLEEVKSKHKQHIFEIRFDGMFDPKNLNEEEFKVLRSENQRLLVKSKQELKAHEVLQKITKYNIKIIGFQELLPSLNEIFINLVTK